MAKLPVTGDPEADALNESDAFALLLSMLLDQQVPMEWAFSGPLGLKRRLGDFGARVVADAGEDAVVELFRAKPGLHRYPGSMGKRAWQLAAHIVEHYGGDGAAVWRDAADGDELLRRLLELPGYGDQKARIFVAILGKRFGVQPEGWERAAGPFADGSRLSVADVDSPEAVEVVRASKRAAKGGAAG